MKDQSKAEDVVQDVFVKFWEQLSYLQTHDHQKAFLFKATKNRSIDEIRKDHTRQKALEDWKLDEDWSEKDDEEMQKLIYLEKINKAIDSLPEKCREIFILHKKEGYSYLEIAKMKNLAKKTVENQMLIALKKLRLLVTNNRNENS